MVKRVYDFSEGNKDMKDLLGGKGANLAEMVNMELRVPPGFTITTKTCAEFFEAKGKFPSGLWAEVMEHLKGVEKATGKKFGDAKNPLLFSVRSGAPRSMPGMMDTVLNLGINDAVAEGLSKLTKDERFVYDAYRRFVTMFADVVMGAERKDFDKVHEAWKEKEGVKSDTELSPKALKAIVVEQKKLFKKVVKTDFPEDPEEQLKLAIAAVFNSWNTPRAITYRKMERIPDEMGTACNIQTMVFGNLVTTRAVACYSRVTRAAARRRYSVSYSSNAQGEDVVAGIRTPLASTT